MLVLAIESATERAGVALADEEGLMVEVSSGRGHLHVETIAPAVVFVCETAGISLAEIDAVAIDVGPGLFTGLRVGVSTAKTLAYALGCQLVVVSSLRVLAKAALDAAGELDERDLVAVVDARRAEVFWARFSVKSGSLLQIGEDRIDTPEALAESLGDADRPTVLVGNGALRYSSLLGAVPQVRLGGSSLAHPPPGSLAVLGVEGAMAGEMVDPRVVEPRYLREADVRINWTMRDRPGVVESSGVSR